MSTRHGQSMRHMLLALALIAVPHLIYIAIKWFQVPIHDGTPIGASDPDPWLRLTLVREWLTGGDWYDHLVRNSNAPIGGIASPWTRPLDMAIAALVKLQPANIDLNIRLVHAALVLPWIWMTLLLLGCYRLIRNLTPLPSAYLMASVLVAAMPLTWNYFGLGNADHHAPLAVLFVWALGGVMSPHPNRRIHILAGILLGLQLWISVEALILIGAVYAWYGLRWLRGEPKTASTLIHIATAVAVTATAATMIERPMAQWFMPIYDTISIVYVVILMLAALLAALLRFAPSTSMLGRGLFAAMGAIGLLLTLHATYPLAFKGPMAEVTPFIFTHFLPRISEAQPLWHMPWLVALAALVQPLAALLLCALSFLSPRRTFYTRQQAVMLGFFLLITLLLYVSQQRWSYYLYPLVACTLAPALGALFTPEHPQATKRWPANLIAHLSDSQQALRRLPVILAVIGLPLGLMLLSKGYEKHWNTSIQDTQIERRDACYTTARRLLYSGALTKIGGKDSLILLAPTDLGAEILFWTKHRIIASNYHREGEAIAYVWGADNITNPNQLHRYLQRRKVEALLICPTVGAPPASTLQQLLMSNTPPAWLQKIAYTMPAYSGSKPEAAENAPRIFLLNNR